MKPKVCIFLGNDIFSWLTCHDFLCQLHDSVDFKVFLPASKGKSSSINELYNQTVYERLVLQNMIYPFISNYDYTLGEYSSISNLSQKTGVNFEAINDINSHEFIKTLAYFDGLISIRCYQKFSVDYMDLFNGKLIWNLHPGDLPGYRGVMTFYRAMINREKNFRITLHEMDQYWDAGPILGKINGHLNYDKCFLSNMILSGKMAGYFLSSSLRAQLFGDKLQSTRQGEYKYWGFPTQDEIKTGYTQGIKLYDHEELKKEYIKCFLTSANEDIMSLFSREFDSYILRCLR